MIFSHQSGDTWVDALMHIPFLFLFLILMLVRAHVMPGAERESNNHPISSLEMSTWSPVAEGNMHFFSRQYFNIQLGFIIVKLLVTLIVLYHGALFRGVSLALF